MIDLIREMIDDGVWFLKILFGCIDRFPDLRKARVRPGIEVVYNTSQDIDLAVNLLEFRVYRFAQRGNCRVDE